MIYWLLYRYLFMNVNKIVSFYGQYQTIPISVGSLTIVSLTITNIPKYTLKFRLSKVHRIINNYLLYIMHVHVEFIPVYFALKK